jgi:hypothetical protein
MSKNEEDILRYDKMVEYALRGVVRQAVEEVIDVMEEAKGGGPPLPGDHHFYITFMTDYPGVDIPAYLRDRYPGEMTIVLQYQFYDLSVDDEKMSVTLSFNNVPERLVVPLGAITIFADPSVNFALQFQPLGESDDDFDPDGESLPEEGKKDDKKGRDDKRGEVVSLDQFRKGGGDKK